MATYLVVGGDRHGQRQIVPHPSPRDDARTAGNGRGYGGRTRHSSLMRAGPFPTEAPRGIGKRGITRTCDNRNQKSDALASLATRPRIWS